MKGLWWVPVAVLVMVLAVSGLLIVAARHGEHTRRAIYDCHARGPRFHYWQERGRCVEFVDGR